MALRNDSRIVVSVEWQMTTNVMTRLIELVEAENLRDKMFFICGDLGIIKEMAIESGYNSGFGFGTFANHVATYIVNIFIKKTQNRTT